MTQCLAIIYFERDMWHIISSSDKDNDIPLLLDT